MSLLPIRWQRQIAKLNQNKNSKQPDCTDPV